MITHFEIPSFHLPIQYPFFSFIYVTKTGKKLFSAVFIFSVSLYILTRFFLVCVLFSILFCIPFQIHSVENFVCSVNSHLTTRQENERLKGIMARIESYDVVVCIMVVCCCCIVHFYLFTVHTVICAVDIVAI